MIKDISSGPHFAVKTPDVSCFFLTISLWSNMAMEYMPFWLGMSSMFIPRVSQRWPGQITSFHGHFRKLSPYANPSTEVFCMAHWSYVAKCAQWIYMEHTSMELWLLCESSASLSTQSCGAAENFHCLSVCDHYITTYSKHFAPRSVHGSYWWNCDLICFNQWVDLRENLQETINFPMKYGSFL